MVRKDGAAAQTSSVNVKEKRNVKCYQCKKYGHYRNQCEKIERENKISHAFSAVFYTGDFQKSDFYVDSGASSHITCNEHWVIDACYSGSFDKEIMVANKTRVPVICSGNMNITTSTKECDYDIVVENVLCVPSLTTNLLSVSQLIKQGNKAQFTVNGCKIFNKKRTLVATATLINGVYKLDTVTCFVASVVESPSLWHRRLGHVCSHSMNKMQNAVEGIRLEEKADISKSNCAVCCEGKQSRLPFAHEGNRSTELLNVVHCDVAGPMESPSLGGSRTAL